MLHIGKLTNVRDLGGYETQDGYYTKSHKFVRSTCPSGIDDELKEKFYEYGIRTVVDLRSDYELVHQPHSLPYGVMAALQVLVLSVQVRILVRLQQRRPQIDLQASLFLLWMFISQGERPRTKAPDPGRGSRRYGDGGRNNTACRFSCWCLRRHCQSDCAR